MKLQIMKVMEQNKITKKYNKKWIRVITTYESPLTDISYFIDSSTINLRSLKVIDGIEFFADIKLAPNELNCSPALAGRE